MPLVLKDRVQETTTTTGTGTVTLAGAVAGFQSFSVIGNGNTTYYTITSPTDFEVGVGTYTAAGTLLSRDTILESSNSGSAVNFAAGVKTVFVTYPAERAVDTEITQTLTNKTIDITSNTLTGVQASLVSGTNIKSINGNSLVGSGDVAIGSVVQYPQNSQSADYTLVLDDAGKQIFHPASDTLNRTFTIPANSSVAYPIGTVLLFTVENGGRSITVATSDTLVFGSGTTGNIVVVPNNTLACIKVTTTKWMANYLYQSGGAFELQAIAVAHTTTPFISVYPWSGSGFGTKYANPVTFSGSTSGNEVAFTSAGDAIAVTHNNPPSIMAYPWSGLGFGTKYADPATLPVGSGLGVAFSPAGDAIAVGHTSTPFISAYPWSGSGFGTKYADPTTLPTGAGQGVAFTSAGDAIAVSHSTTPFISTYPWSGSGFGTKFSDPGILPASTGTGVAFTSAGDAIAVSHSTTPFISTYPWSGSGFGTKFSDPGTLPTGNGLSVAFSPAGDAIAVGHVTTPFISTYPWSGSGFGTKFSNPTTLPTGFGYGVAFTSAGDAIAVSHSITPFISAYPWSGSGFGTKYANPGTLPTGSGNSVAFNINP